MKKAARGLRVCGRLCDLSGDGEAKGEGEGRSRGIAARGGGGGGGGVVPFRVVVALRGLEPREIPFDLAGDDFELASVPHLCPLSTVQAKTPMPLGVRLAHGLPRDCGRRKDAEAK